MATPKIPEGIVRSVSVVTADDAVTAVYVDGIRKLHGYNEDYELQDLSRLLVEEGASGKVIHVSHYTCDTFYQEVCLSDPEIFCEVVPELLQHLKVDGE